MRNASPQTNRSIAEFVGVGERAVANWIAGGGITYDNAKAVAELFDVDPQWLWAGREKGKTPDLSEQIAELQRAVEALHDDFAKLLSQSASEDASRAQERAQSSPKPSARKKRAAG